MTATPINPAAIQALAAYGTPARTPAPAPDKSAFVPALPSAPAGSANRGVSVALSPEARDTLIAIQSAASGAQSAPAAQPAAPRAAASPYQATLPGSTLDLKI